MSAIKASRSSDTVMPGGGLRTVVVMRMLLLLLLTATGCSNQPFGAVKPNATEKMMWSTYTMSSTKGAATGFVINCTDARRPRGFVPVVVTAAHLLESVGKGPLLVAIRAPDVSGEPQVVAIPISFPKTRGAFFVRHPRLDVGAFEPDLPPGLGEIILPSFLKEKSTFQSRAALRAGSEVSFLGFPDALPGSSGGFPILRNGKVASYPTAELQAEKAFFIDADVYPGDSGAPVFAVDRSGRPVLMGMIVQRIGRNKEAFSHFAVAVDREAIRETLQLLAERSGRAPSQKPLAR